LVQSAASPQKRHKQPKYDHNLLALEAHVSAVLKLRQHPAKTDGEYYKYPLTFEFIKN